MNWLKFWETLLSIFPFLEKYIDLKIAELPMKVKEHDEKTELREKRLERRLIKVSFKTDRTRKRKQRKRDKKDVQVVEEENDNNE